MRFGMANVFHCLEDVKPEYMVGRCTQACTQRSMMLPQSDNFMYNFYLCVLIIWLHLFMSEIIMSCTTILERINKLA